MLYLFSFKKLDKPIILSEKRNISLTNISTEYEMKFFVNQFFKYQVNTNLWIIPKYFWDHNSLENIIKIDSWVDFQDYTQYKFSMNPENRTLVENTATKISDNHNIINVFLFALSLIAFNDNLNESNIYLENLDSNKYQKLESKISMEQFVKYLDFNVIEKDLLNLFWFFDFQYNKYNIQNFIYIGELLELYHSTKSDYFKFAQLVSIIEFILFNKEKEKLEKQFIFKTWVIMERLAFWNSILDKKQFSILWFNGIDSNKELKAIYDIRSHIVHWSIKELHAKYPKKEWEFNDFQGLFFNLKRVTAWLLYTYIQYPEYINFLKSN